MIPTISRMALVALVLAVAVMLQVSAFNSTASAASADSAKAKKALVEAPQDCAEAVEAVNVALRDRVVPLYRLKVAQGSKARKTWKKKVKSADKKVNAARAALKVQCQRTGTTSALESNCSITFTQLDELIGLEYDLKMQLRKIKGNAKKAKARKKVLRKHLNLLAGQIQAQNTILAMACDKSGYGYGYGEGEGEGEGGGYGDGSGSTGDTTAPEVTILDGAPRWDGRHNFTFTSSEPGTVFQCKVDFGVYLSATSPYTTAVLANGGHTFACIGTDAAGNASAPVAKAFSVFRDPTTVSKTTGFQWGLACTGGATLNSPLGCPDDGLSIRIPASPNGITGTYLVDLTGQINGLSSAVGIGSTFTMYVIVDGSSVASDSETILLDFLGIIHIDLAASRLNLTLSAASSHTIQLSLKSSSILGALPSVNSSSLRASIYQ